MNDRPTIRPNGRTVNGRQLWLCEGRGVACEALTEKAAFLDWHRAVGLKEPKTRNRKTPAAIRAIEMEALYHA